MWCREERCQGRALLEGRSGDGPPEAPEPCLVALSRHVPLAAASSHSGLTPTRSPGGPRRAGRVEPKVKAPGGTDQILQLLGSRPANVPSVGSRWVEAFCRSPGDVPGPNPNPS